MRLVDEVVAVRGMRYREEVQVQLRAQGMQQRQLVYRERSDEKDVVTCESIRTSLPLPILLLLLPVQLLTYPTL